jgi:DNA helicase-2/ATP-dependent DNA helicase PcrA
MQLSKAQQEAVNYLGGPHIILAGAGSGKTRVIVEKARHLVQDIGHPPNSILVITYSTKTQAELEERITSVMPSLAADGEESLQIRTFHALGMDILSEFGYHLGLSADITKVGDHRLWQYHKRAIGELLESDLLDTNQPDKVYRDLKAFVDRAKDELVTPDDVITRAERELLAIPSDDNDENILRRDKWAKVLEAGKIFKSYERIKSEEGRNEGVGSIDYGDMIVLSHRLLTNNRVAAAAMRTRLRHILVDEFQDANFAQVEILRLLAGPDCGVTVVGDDDQAIYRFRGASFASFRLFQKLFPGWKVFRLEENYRSQGNVVRAAQSLIEADPAARFDAGKRMAPVRPAAARVVIRKCPDELTEASHAADEIEKLLGDEKFQKPKSIAVLVRVRRHKDLLLKALERKGIAYFYDRPTSELRTRQGRLLLDLYGFAIDPERTDLLRTIMIHFLPGLRPEAEREINYRLGRGEGRQGTTDKPLEILKAASEEMKDSLPAGMAGLIELLARLTALSAEHNPLQLLERIIEISGLLKGPIVEGQIVDREALGEIAQVLRVAEKYQGEYRNPSHAEFTDYLAWHGSFGNENDREVETEASVVIQTVHGSKGLEYPAVFVIGCSNRRFPPQKQSAILDFPSELYKEELPSGDYRIQEERRLFYVAMTRARELLYLYGIEKKGTKISQFISELEKSSVFAEVATIEKPGAVEPLTQIGIGPAIVSDDPTAAIVIPVSGSVEKSMPESLMELWRKQSATIKSPDEFESRKSEFVKGVGAGVTAFMEAVANEQFDPKEPPKRKEFETVSYTDLESFKTCPLQFYFRKALRIPTPSNANAFLGSAIHTILQEAGQALKDGCELKLDQLVASFDKHWAGVSLPDPDRKERLRVRGRDLLERFVRMQESRSGKPIELERKFSIRNQKPEISTQVVGRIDRIDSTPEGYEVIDYKTGKQKSAADLKGDLQLPIYAMACQSLLGKLPARVTYIFLGDDSQHAQTYTPDEIDAIMSEIGAVIEQINSSDFVATPGHHCQQCAYAHICPAKQEG